MKKVASVDDYLKSVPKDMRTALNKLRKIIKAAAPDADEVISYQIPAFRQNGVLVWYAAFKDHCSFFPGSSQVLRQFSAELKPFEAGTGTLHFTPDRPLPTDLVKRIVKARVAENAARHSKYGRHHREANPEDPPISKSPRTSPESRSVNEISDRRNYTPSFTQNRGPDDPRLAQIRPRQQKIAHNQC